jgi:tyrosine-protein phosphatase YwqE
MLSFLKSKPKLKELIPSGFTDIHSHLLPGLDDGAQTIKETQSMVEQLKTIGFAKCIVTPHTLPEVWENTTDGIQTTFIETRKKLKEPYNEILFRAASEYMINDIFLDRLSSHPLLTLKDNYILIEMSYLNPPYALYEIIFEIKHKGYIPILAHPERYIFYHNTTKEYENLKKNDVLFQVNLLSTVGYYGRHVAKIADLLLKKDYIDYVGSDIHHKGHVMAFENKLIIKSENKLKNAIQNNNFFSNLSSTIL